MWPAGWTRPSGRTGRKENTADAEHKPSRAPSVKKGVSGVPTVGNPGGIYSKQDSELAPGCAGGRGHRVARPGKSERRAAVDAPAGYRNGHGKTRRLSMMTGTIELKRPRVRGLEQRFESRLLPLFARRTEAVSELLPQLYFHGLAQGDFELALRGLLGDGAPLSASAI